MIKFVARPRYAMTSWTLVAATAAYAATTAGRRRGRYDREHDRPVDRRGYALAHDLDLEPRLVRKPR
jgi:hypothetical protein